MSQGKVREKSGNFEVGFLYEPWQAVILVGIMGS